MQYNVAKEKFDYNFDGLDRNRYKKMEQQQKASDAQSQGNVPSQDNAQTAAAKFFVPKRLLGKELTPEQQEKFGKMETIYVTGMKDRDGQPFNAYVRMNLDRGKPDFFRYNPDSRPQDTGSGEQRCNRRSHQACATTAETGGGTTGASRSRQAGGKERSEEKERQRKKIIKT